MVDFEAIEYEYLDWHAFQDDDRMRELKDRVRSLPEGQKRILYLYLDLGTYTDVAKLLKCSPSSVRKTIKKVRRKLCSGT